MRILFVASELFPYVKTGGLGDVMAALPRAMRALGADVRFLLPVYPAIRSEFKILGEAAALPELMGGGPARILRAEAPGLPLYLLDQPAFFDRPGGPYEHPGTWPGVSPPWPGRPRTWAARATPMAGGPRCCTATTGPPGSCRPTSPTARAPGPPR